MILNDEQKMIQEMMRNYSQQETETDSWPYATKQHNFQHRNLKELGELGALGMTVAEQWGGAGQDYVSLKSWH